MGEEEEELEGRQINYVRGLNLFGLATRELCRIT